jgi:N-carbamoylputrescine amidase
MTTVAAIQCAFSMHWKENIQKIEHYITAAHKEHANIILSPELFANHYFCKTQKAEWFEHAHAVNNHPWLNRFSLLARQLAVVLPISFFEKDNNCYYNSLAVFDTNGDLLQVYRKSHIPDGPGYQEKFYFRPGNTGFNVLETTFGKLGFGICWDQWFPEVARILTLQGADILFYPTAIGSEPENPNLSTHHMWRSAMLGHSASNIVGVVAANRVGQEDNQTFYGYSFIADSAASIVSEMDHTSEGFITANLDIESIRKNRAGFGFFRDRRPDLYQSLCKQ